MQKILDPLGGAVFGIPPPRPKAGPSQGPFLTVFAMFMHVDHSSKKEQFFDLWEGVGGTGKVPL